MPRLILSILLLTLAWPLPAVVLISEYIEGSSLNKGIELFNSDAVSDFDDLSDVTVNHSGTSTLSLTVNSGAVVDGAGNPNSDTLTSDGVIIDPDPSPPGDYYANVDPSSATSLRATLHDTIHDHQWFPYTDSSPDTWDILELADEDPNDSTRILAVYENETYAKVGGGNSNYNREHTWPRSYGLGQTGTQFNTAATDAHNLRLSNIDYNSDRGNKPFAACDPGINAQCSERVTVFNDGVGGMGGPYPGDSNWTTLSTDGNQGSWEVWNDRRGDIARTMFYMAIRYEGGTHGVTGFQEPDLELTNDRNLIQTASGGTVYMGLLDTLLEWHEQDPVDDRERDRNETVFVFQTNRNPFVDHPEWVDCLWNDICTAADQIFSDAFRMQPNQ